MADKFRFIRTEGKQPHLAIYKNAARKVTVDLSRDLSALSATITSTSVESKGVSVTISNQGSDSSTIYAHIQPNNLGNARIIFTATLSDSSKLKQVFNLKSISDEYPYQDYI